MNISFDYCLAAISELQNNAIDKLRARDDFQKTGVATLKIRAPCTKGGTKLLTVQQKLSDIGSDLQRNVANEMKIQISQIKLISSGKVIDPNGILSEQGIKNNHQILALTLTTTVEENQQEDQMYDRVRKVKEDAALLMDAKTSFMQMEDQAGNVVHLPPSERKNLTMALALHEKGRGALKREAISEALVLFLEADSEYGKCSQMWLDAVDNYALLNLDIVWCYLCLKSIMQLPDADRRLQICEKNLKKSYGEDMGRVVALKGTSGNEKALLMRLHLLQAVICFHQNRRSECEGILLLAESELRSLKISDESLNTLVDMGYTPLEARTGLRSCNGDVYRTVEHIMEKREKKVEARKKAAEEMKLDKLLKKSSSDEEWVNPRNLHVLVGMGFSQTHCALALKKCKNDMSLAINMLQDNYEQLSIELSEEVKPEPDLLDQITKIGFPKEIVEMALKYNTNDMEKTVEYLLSLQSNNNFASTLEMLTSQLLDGASTSSGSADVNDLKEKFKKRIKTDLEEREALERFSEDVSAEGDDHLDLALVQEENILIEYKKFLNID